MATQEHFDADHIHTTPEGRHFRHGDGVEVDGEGNPIGIATIIIGKDFDGKTLVRLSAELIATLTPTGHSSCMRYENGEYRRANGFSGVIAGGQGSYWITPEGDTPDLNRLQIERLCK